MYRYLTRTTWFVLVFVVLLVGGFVIVLSQFQQDQARDRLTLLRIANSNMALVTQARIDVVLDQVGLAITGAEDDDVARHADFLRSLSEDAEPRLGYLLDSIAALDEERAYRMMIGLTLDLDALEWATMGPVRDELEAATVRGWWALGLTGTALLTLLVIELRRPQDEH